jgi:hypothetical protein
MGAAQPNGNMSQIIYIDMTQKIEGATVKMIPQKPFTSNPLAQSPCTDSVYRTQKKPEGWED